MEVPRKIEIEQDLRDCGKAPIPPDPDDPSVTQKQVGDFLIALMDYSFRCDNRNLTMGDIIDRHNADVKSR